MKNRDDEVEDKSFPSSKIRKYRFLGEFLERENIERERNLEMK